LAYKADAKFLQRLASKFLLVIGNLNSVETTMPRTVATASNPDVTLTQFEGFLFTHMGRIFPSVFAPQTQISGGRFCSRERLFAV
jgi:hypothetical protein